MKYMSVVAMTALVMVGCGGTGSKAPASNTFVEKSAKASSVVGLKSFGVNPTTKETMKVSKATAAYDSQKGQIDDESTGEICESGTMTFPHTSSNGNYSFVADHCKNGTSTIDGTVNIVSSEAQKSADIKVVKTFTLLEDSDSLRIDEGSRLKLTENSLSTDFKAKVNGELLSASNLTASFDVHDTGITLSFTGGELNVGEYYFKFVEQTEPFFLGDDAGSGLLKLVDGAGHNVEVAVVGVDTVELRIDENGNGTFEESEKEIFSDN